MLYKRCSSCGNRIPSNIKCQCQIDNMRQRYREYNAKRNDKEEQAFYRDITWSKCRDDRKIELLNIDWFEYYTTGEIVEGNTMHHIEELRENKSRALDKSNLIFLTQANHINIHKAYLKSDKEKKKMQRILFIYLERIKKEFGIG